MKRAQAGAMAVRQNAAAVGAGDHRHPGIRQRLHRLAALNAPPPSHSKGRFACLSCAHSASTIAGSGSTAGARFSGAVSSEGGILAL